MDDSKNKKIVSFFVPRKDLSDAAYNYLGKPMFDSCFTTSSLPLPLKLEKIGTFVLPLDGDDFPKYECGEYWVLYTLSDMPMIEFDAVLESLQTNTFAHRGIEEIGKYNDGTTIDTDLMPSDVLAAVCVYCLDDLSIRSYDENVKLFAKLFARHICAFDMNMIDIIKYDMIVSMIIDGFKTWIVEDGFLYSDALEARTLLEATLNCKVVGPIYKQK